MNKKITDAIKKYTSDAAIYTAKSCLKLVGKMYPSDENDASEPIGLYSILSMYELGLDDMKFDYLNYSEDKISFSYAPDLNAEVIFQKILPGDRMICIKFGDEITTDFELVDLRQEPSFEDLYEACRHIFSGDYEKYSQNVPLKKRYEEGDMKHKILKFLGAAVLMPELGRE